MDYLFVELMLWGQGEGYAVFSLGMAPLSGLEHHPLATLWNRVGNLVFRFGDEFYNFDGLRKYKQKFHPEWEPRYLAAPGGLALPRVLVDATTLISGARPCRAPSTAAVSSANGVKPAARASRVVIAFMSIDSGSDGDERGRLASGTDAAPLDPVRTVAKVTDPEGRRSPRHRRPS